jgi:hypothetical protein
MQLLEIPEAAYIYNHDADLKMSMVMLETCREF